MAKKSKKKRRSRGPVPKGKPGAATRTQAKTSAKGAAKEKAKSGTKKKGERRDLFDLARATTQTQRFVAATIVVIIAATAGFFAGRSQGSASFRDDREQALAEAVTDDDAGDVDAPITFTVGSGDEEREICVAPADDYAVTDGACPG